MKRRDIKQLDKLIKKYKMKVYYAHSMHLYNTPQEKRDIDLLKSLGFEVVNPNIPEIQAEVEKRKKEGNENYMLYFNEVISSCDALAFRSLVDGSIPAGVGKEIKYAIDQQKPYFELSTLPSTRFLSVEDTRLFLQLNGQR